MILWSGHNHAPFYLAGVSFAESSFFPIPPDVMLVSMGLSTPKNAWKYAFIATLFSVLGGILGYAIGFYFMKFLSPYLMATSYAHAINTVTNWFDNYGLWIVILAGFTPFPYKVFTVTSGAMVLNFFLFVLGSIIGRGLRFFLVAAILYFVGPRIEPQLKKYIDVIGWSVLFIFVMVYVSIKLL